MPLPLVPPPLDKESVMDTRMMQKVLLHWDTILAAQTLQPTHHNSSDHQHPMPALKNLILFASELMNNLFIVSEKRLALFYSCNKAQFHCLQGVIALPSTCGWEDLDFQLQHSLSLSLKVLWAVPLLSPRFSLLGLVLFIGLCTSSIWEQRKEQMFL